MEGSFWFEMEEKEMWGRRGHAADYLATDMQV